MRIRCIETWALAMPLTRPYTIAFKTFRDVEIAAVQIETDTGLVGLGTASPVAEVTGETIAACTAVLQSETDGPIIGKDTADVAWDRDEQMTPRMCKTPAALAALNMAAFDLAAQAAGRPLVDLFGRKHGALATSITIGIKPLDETLAEAEEYLGRGFRILKVKTGHGVEEDIEKLSRLREQVGPRIGIRVDPNQGYNADDVLRFVRETESLDIEFLEQPMPADAIEEMRSLPVAVRAKLAADESLHTSADVERLVIPTHACGIWNIKLMKCGGLLDATRISARAELEGIELMWGCMDESIVSISAALHLALACPTTRYLDLDGSLDLARDIVEGGFILKDGMMDVPPRPGLGVQLRR